MAIIGGGCASIAAAFDLTRPELGGRYEVTVYQLGWRLGGKGASGRGPADRIEEHGIHLWMGFYENAFRLMRECYAELQRDREQCPIADWRDAFAPVPLVGVTERDAAGAWWTWKGVLPITDGLPGDPQEDGRRWSVADYMKRSVELLLNLLRTIALQDARPAAAPAGPTADRRTARDLTGGIAELLRYGAMATLAGLIQGVELLKLAVASLAAVSQNDLLRFLDAIRANASRLLEERLAQDPPVRAVWQVIDLTLATLRGEVRFGLMTDPRGFDAIDDYDCREWLLLNGASESSVGSAFVRALYDLVFAYEHGDPSRPRISAGVALRCMVRSFFTYRGAFFWTMQAGMGDVVFAPFYEVLKRRGVRFEFFHRLERVRLADPASLQDGQSPHVAALEFDVQALTRDGGEYRPLVTVHGLPCWPSQPDLSQLVDGERLAQEGWEFESHWDRRKTRTKILRVGEEFDLVVLGVGIGVVPHVCQDILARDARWRAMVDHVKTVATQAFQLWMSAEMRELGWDDPPIVLSGFTEPFDSWGDMRHLIARESWPRPPHALAYFCSALLDPVAAADRADAAYPAGRRAEVRDNIVRFLNHDIAHLWRDAARAPGEFRWDVLVSPQATGAGDAASPGPERIASQFWTANVNPSDRYSLSLPGSSAHRISPLDRTYDNLTIAGDWTDCGLNAGCVEAAVMSGRLAAHAIAQWPPLTAIFGYDHP
ncbi:MAG: NAD(P)-binding protein [Candidatus Binatia bacterium]